MEMTWRSARRAAIYALGFILGLPVVWRLLLFYGEIWFTETGAEFFAGLFTFVYAVAAYFAVAFVMFDSEPKTKEDRP